MTKIKPADYLFWAVRQQTGNTLRNHILIILADHRNHKTGRCDPSHATIAKRVGCSDRAVRDHIAILEKDGFISVERRFKDGMKTSSQYSFPLVGADRKEVPIDRKEVPKGTERGSVRVRNEVPINHLVLTTNRTTHITPIVPLGFDDFYALYPKKAGRQAAEKAWKKLKPSPALINRIREDIKNRVDQGAWCTGEGKQFIPNPSTYLNQARWEDDIIPRPEFKPSPEQLAAKTQRMIDEINAEDSWIK